MADPVVTHVLGETEFGALPDGTPLGDQWIDRGIRFTNGYAIGGEAWAGMDGKGILSWKMFPVDGLIPERVQFYPYPPAASYVLAQFYYDLSGNVLDLGTNTVEPNTFLAIAATSENQPNPDVGLGEVYTYYSSGAGVYSVDVIQWGLFTPTSRVGPVARLWPRDDGRGPLGGPRRLTPGSSRSRQSGRLSGGYL